MARTKQTVRKSTGYKTQCRRGPPCYAYNMNNAHPPPTSRRSSLRLQEAGRGNSSYTVPRSKSSEKRFEFFPKLPAELRARIWEMVADEGRIVAVRSIADDGLRSMAPPILHVCVESRAIGLQHYTLSFSATTHYFSGDAVPPRIYFNFNRDTLYFGKDWNEGVDGRYSCISHFSTLIDKDDLQRVRAIGFHLDAKACCARSVRQHSPDLRQWTGLETVYLALERSLVHKGAQIDFRKIPPADWGRFMQGLRRNQHWPLLYDGFDETKPVEYIICQSNPDNQGTDSDEEHPFVTVYPVQIMDL